MTKEAHHSIRRFYLHHYRGGWLDSIRDVIFGLEDGMVSTLGVIVGIAAGTANRSVVLFSGAVVVLVEALSMSAGTYLSTKSEKELEQHFIREEEEEIDRDAEDERREVAEILQRQGYSQELQQQLLLHITSDKKRWLEFMALHELKVIPEDTRLSDIIRNAAAMWLSYIIGGVIALLAFAVAPLAFAPVLAIIIVVIALFLLGTFKGLMLRLNWLTSGLEMTIISLLAAGVGHLVGSIFSRLLNVNL